MLFKHGKVKQSVGKLLDSFIIKMTENTFDNHLVTLTLLEYAQMTDKKNLKELRKQTNSDLQILRNVKIKSEPKGNGKSKYIEAKLCQCSEKINNGKLKFKFSDELFKVLDGKGISFFRYIPNEVLKFNETITNVYLLYKKILSHCWTNAGKKRENIMKIRELYNYCSTLPRYDGIEGAVKYRIKIPLERDLEKIDSFTYTYLNGDYDKLQFNEWLDVDLVINWKEELLRN